MSKFIAISDSFKGTLSSTEINNMLKQSLLRKYPGCDVLNIPIGDGGEGSLECIKHFVSGKIIKIRTVDPYFNEIEAKYYLSDKNEAYIESASCIGLTLNKDNNPTIASSYGLGIMIKDAIDRKVKKVYLLLGGSATNDAGCGLASALGVRFISNNNQEFIPCGKNINEIKTIISNKIETKIVCLCDVKSKMYGKYGASKLFAKQKGANEKEIELLENNLKYLNDLFIKQLSVDASNIKYGGAAGAISAGAYVFFNAKLVSGIDQMLRIVDFDNKLDNCNMVFTGEGKIDSQSNKGKVIDGIIKRCQKKNVPVILIAGKIEKQEKVKLLKNKIIQNIYTTNNETNDFEIIKKTAKDDYQKVADKVIESFKI